MFYKYNNIRVFPTLNFYLGKGISHFCCKSEAVKNLIMLAEGLGNVSSEQVASGILKIKMKRDNIKSGDKFPLKTFGNNLLVVGTPDNKCSRASVKKLSLETIMEISNTLNLSKRKTNLLCKHMRQNLGKKMLEPNIATQIEELHNIFSDFYDVKTESFISGDEEISRSLVFVKDTSDLILHMINERSLNPYSTIARISIDGGQGFLKCVINVFDPLCKYTTSESLDDCGVKRSLVLALVEDVSEHNGNLSKLLKPLALSDVKYSIAFDLKCGNSLFGLSSHSSKYACLWCEGESTLESGKKRTLGSIDINYNKFIEDGCKKNHIMEFKNCISPRVVYLDEPLETLVEHLIPPPELHILIGITSMFVKILITLWPDFDSWLKSNYIIYRGYHRTGLDGNNSQRLLDKLDNLEVNLLSAASILPNMIFLQPVVSCLRKFSIIKTKGFSMFIGESIAQSVLDFKKAFENLQLHLLEKFNYQLNISWKVHILVCHLVPFLQHSQFGLGVYAEQAGESAHHYHYQVWKRYKCRLEHNDYAKQLKKSVIEFGINSFK